MFSFSVVVFAEGENNNTEDPGKNKLKGFSLENRQSVDKQFYSFSLRSGMYFKGENLINGSHAQPNNNVNLNSITFQKGENSYLLPYKKKAVLNKLTFNPNELLRNYSGK
ncbi:MAG TPA: hypothetical protein PK191_08375 [Niabella sp.]|nr:hypothetical protein [Niabella sp.]HOZ95653.1 hypothetical protein [Niabella sp.]HQW13893.1 hypothetical protein [Niabella sp.]HQX19214.1 hypothetical protein [Niabella sp.]HQX42254.1 hypothetical protein [Niabella sp.]